MIKKNKITVAIMTAVITATLGLTACSSEDVTSVLSTTIGQDTTESSNSGDVNEAENPGQDQGQEPAGEGRGEGPPGQGRRPRPDHPRDALRGRI